MLSFVLVPIVAINLYAGSKALGVESYGKTIKSAKASMSTYQNDEVVFVPSSQMNESKEILEVKKSFFDNIYELFVATGLSIEEILSNYSVESNEYAGALYAKLKLAGMSNDVVERELDNIITFGYTYTDTTEETWQELFGNLLTTINYDENVMDYYYPLAKCWHLSSCNQTHEHSIFGDGRINCHDIEIKLASMMQDSVSGTDFVIQKVYESQNESLIASLEKILYANVDVDSCLLELENVYELAVVPMCVPEEVWLANFANLLGTVSEYENVCDVYYELACFVHKLTCNFEHYINEFGSQECEDVKLSKKL